MHFLLVLLSLAGIGAVPLSDIAETICSCAQCALTPISFNTPVNIVSYGNATAPQVFDMILVAQDFYPGPVQLTGNFNCSKSIAYLLNGSSIMTSPFFNASCYMSITEYRQGDFALVILVKDPNAPETVPISMDEMPTGVPLAIATGGDTLELNPDYPSPDCALPAVIDGVSQEQCGDYPGVAFSSSITGCRGDPLVATPPPPPALWVRTIPGRITLGTSTTASVILVSLVALT